MSLRRFEQYLLTKGRGRTLLGLEKPPPSAYIKLCTENLTRYLNSPEVQVAIHADHAVAWSMCSDEVYEKYNKTDQTHSMMPYWKELIEDGSLKIMIYSGDNDAIVSTFATQQWIWDLGYSALEDKYWIPWQAEDQPGQLAGFRTSFDVPSRSDFNASFTFVTVHSAGHMVPATQPKRSLELLASFLGLQK